MPTPDLTIDHVPANCAACGLPLRSIAGEDYLARQVFDLPVPVPLVVTEHRAHRCRCAACGTQTRAVFPEAVSAPVQYGARIAAFVVYLMNYQFEPEGRLATLMADLFGVSLSRATIGQMSRRAAERLQGFAEAVRERIVSAPVKHLDETGFFNQVDPKQVGSHLDADSHAGLFAAAKFLISGPEGCAVGREWMLATVPVWSALSQSLPFPGQTRRHPQERPLLHVRHQCSACAHGCRSWPPRGSAIADVPQGAALAAEMTVVRRNWHRRAQQRGVGYGCVGAVN